MYAGEGTDKSDSDIMLVHREITLVCNLDSVKITVFGKQVSILEPKFEFKRTFIVTAYLESP